MQRQKLIILRGYPGSGKTTIGKALFEEGVGRFIDHNEILTFVASIVGDDENIYDELAQLEQAMCRKLLAAGNTVIVARGFSAAKSIREYLQIADLLNVDSYVIRLDVFEDVLRSRVKSKDRQNDFNPTVTDESLLQWISDNPLEDFNGETILDNEQSVSTVVHQIIEILH
jgi:predicted kinase